MTTRLGSARFSAYAIASFLAWTTLASACRAELRPTLAIGAKAPAFSLPGADGKTHSLKDYSGHPALIVVFTCNHCPISELYESRIQQISAQYRSQGAVLVAINPDSPATVSDEDLAYSDVPDDLAGMSARASSRHLDYPYLYDGETQAAARAFGVTALPQAFVFDASLTLRYAGRIDDSLDPGVVRNQDLRSAIDDVLAARTVRVAQTASVGCPLKRLESARPSTAEVSPENAPIDFQVIGPPQLKALRANTTSRLTLINFWATWCPPCIVEFPSLQTTYRMYRSRQLDFVTVSIDGPAAEPLVAKILHEHRATSTNRWFGSDDTAALQDAFDPAMPAAVPFTLLLAPNGDVVHQQAGEVDLMALRHAILANLPRDPKYPGLQTYWAER